MLTDVRDFLEGIKPPCRSKVKPRLFCSVDWLEQKQVGDTALDPFEKPLSPIRMEVRGPSGKSVQETSEGLMSHITPCSMGHILSLTQKGPPIIAKPTTTNRTWHLQMKRSN